MHTYPLAGSLGGGTSGVVGDSGWQRVTRTEDTQVHEVEKQPF